MQSFRWKLRFTYLSIGRCGIQIDRIFGWRIFVVIIRTILSGVRGWNTRRVRFSALISIIWILAYSRNISRGYITIQFIQPRWCKFHMFFSILAIIFAMHPSIPSIELTLSGGMVIHSTNVAVSRGRTVFLASWALKIFLCWTNLCIVIYQICYFGHLAHYAYVS